MKSGGWNPYDLDDAEGIGGGDRAYKIRIMCEDCGNPEVRTFLFAPPRTRGAPPHPPPREREIEGGKEKEEKEEREWHAV